MNDKIIELLIKQRQEMEKPEIKNAIEKQEKLSNIMWEKRDIFDDYTDQSLELLKEGTKKFFDKYPEYKDIIPEETFLMGMVENTLGVLINKPGLFSEITKKMNEIEELKEYGELVNTIGESFYNYIVAYASFERQLKKDRKKLFTLKYRDRMSELADEGILLYYLETPDLPLLSPEISGNDILDALYDSNAIPAMLSPFFEMNNIGVSMERKLDDLNITMTLIMNEEYRSAARNLFALLESEHKKAANAFEGIIEKRKKYKKGYFRSKKIQTIVDDFDDEWLSTAWSKVDQYYQKVVASQPVEGVIHRNSIVHGDYNSELIDVDKYSVLKLMLLWLNLRLIADDFCNKTEIFETTIQYLPVLYLLKE